MAYAYSNEPSSTLNKKGSEQDAVIMREFKHKLAEDDDYITYFNERIRIEQSYIDSLNRLHAKTVSVDSLHDEEQPRRPVSSARLAWMEVRDYSLREIECREAFTNALQRDVVMSLVKLRDERTRIRNRIRDDLKNATGDYEEQVFSRVPKLKRSYHNRTHALEEHKKQEHAIAMQAKLLAESTRDAQPDPKPHPYAGPPPGSSQTNTSPLSPNSPSSERFLTPGGDSPPQPSPSPVPSVSFSSSVERERRGVTGRGRSGSGSLTALRDVADSRSKEVFSDIAAQGKKGFSAIMQRFAGGEEGAPSQPEPSAPPRRGSISRSANPMKGVKAKRDADEADKAYRAGVFHCESLRLRREKLQRSAIASVDEFNTELNATLLVTLRKFTNAAHGTAATLSQATDVITDALKRVNLDADTQLYRSREPKIVNNPPILYENFYVGPCRSLIFGVSLTDYDFARGEGGNHGHPPLIVEKCVAALNTRALRAEGLYRLSGRQATVKQLVQDIERNEEAFQFGADEDVYSIAVVLKQYLRELPEPLFPLPHAERVKYTENREYHISNNFSGLRGRLRRLPPIHQTTFQLVLDHLNRVASHLQDNKMDPKNLAVVFNSVLFGQDQVTSSASALTMHLERDTVLEDMITYSDLLFNSPSIRGEPSSPDKAGTGHALLSVTPTPPPPALTPDVHEQLAAMEIERGSELTATFTPDEDLTLLFDPAKIPASMRSAVPVGYHVRPLASDDFLRSHFGLLSNLSVAPPLAPSVYSALFKAIRATDDTYFICAVIDCATDQIVAVGALVKERKFSHGGGSAGHIEDIVLSPSVRGHGLGRTLVEGLRDLAAAVGCYKVILDCQEAMVPFYEKCGFFLRGRQMAFYFPEAEHPATDASHLSEASSTLREEDSAMAETASLAPTLESVGTADTFDTSSSVTYSFPVTPNGSSGTTTPARRPNSQ